MGDLNEKEFRNIFACVARKVKMHEPLVKMAHNGFGWSSSALRKSSFQDLQNKLLWIFKVSSVETILQIEKYGFLDRDPINQLVMTAIRSRSLLNDERFSRLRHRESKFFSFRVIVLFFAQFCASFHPCNLI